MNNSDIVEAFDRKEELPHDSLESPLIVEVGSIFEIVTIITRNKGRVLVRGVTLAIIVQMSLVVVHLRVKVEDRV